MSVTESPEVIPSPQRGGRLTGVVVERLRGRISQMQLQPGNKLPSEQQLCAEFGVSRTVVREAIATLRAQGAVETRHGVGVFVLGPVAGDERALSQQMQEKLTSVLEVLELRLGVEVEAAALAAQRCSAAQEAAIHARFRDIGVCLDAGQDAAEADFRFHLAISEATNNRTYVDVLGFLGHKTIPRSQLAAPDGRPVEGAAGDYLRRVQSEHQEILRAISMRDPDAAREAMRRHLTGSYRRYHSIIFGSNT